MQPIQFRQNPAFVSAGDALGLAFDFLLANLRIWAAPALAYAVVTGVLIGTVMGNVFDDMVAARFDPDASRRFAEALFARLPTFAALFLFVAIATVAVTWLLMALAVGGLPGRRMTVDTALSAGVRSIGAGIVGAVLVGGVMAVVVLGLGLLVRTDAAPLAILGIFVLLPVWVYVALRLGFVFYAVFDGAGPVEAFTRSWAITRGGVLRVFGWGLLLGAINFGVNLGSSFIGASASGVPVATVTVGSVLGILYAAYQSVVMAILYESQRMRHSCTQPGAITTPASAVADTPVDPLAPPPPPPPPAGY